VEMAEKGNLLADDSFQKMKAPHRRWNHQEICALLKLAKQTNLADKTSSISTRNKSIMEQVTKQMQKEDRRITV